MTGRVILVREARMADYDAMVALFDELDEFHRRARPDFFRRFDGPARTREQIACWLKHDGSGWNQPDPSCLWNRDRRCARMGLDGTVCGSIQSHSALAGPGSTVLVAEDDGDVIGLAVLLTRSPSAFAGAVPRKVIELDNLVVRAGHRGRSVGHRLLRAMTRWARGRGATHIEVAVHAFNRDARRFYESFGFVSSIDRLVLTA